MLIANTDLEAKQLHRPVRRRPGAGSRWSTPASTSTVFRPARPRPRRAPSSACPTDAVVLMFAGRIQPLKAPDVLLRAVAVLLDQDPDAALPARRARSSAARPAAASSTPSRWPSSPTELGLDDVVRFVPPVAQPELARWYAAATLVAVPSYNESFGLVAVEAQATGTPVVAAAVGGLTTVVRDGVSGLLVDGHDPRDWAARAARGSSTTTALRARLGAGAPRAGRAVLVGAHRRPRPSRSTSGPRRGAARDVSRSRLTRAAGRPRTTSTDQRASSSQELADGRLLLLAAGGEASCRRRSGSTSARTRSASTPSCAATPTRTTSGVYRWLLERNLQDCTASRFAVDRLGDIYLDGRLPLAAVTPDELDRLLGAVLDHRRRVVQHHPRARASPPRSARSGSGAGCAGSRPRNLEAFRGWLEGRERSGRGAAPPGQRQQPPGAPARPGSDG